MNTKSTLIHHTCMRIPLSKNKKLKKKINYKAHNINKPNPTAKRIPKLHRGAAV